LSGVVDRRLAGEAVRGAHELAASRLRPVRNDQLMVRMRRNPDGSVTEIPPERYRNGHPLKSPNVCSGGHSPLRT
jgi:hypothetical protein